MATATAPTKKGFTVTSPRSNAPLHAVITTDDGANASIFADGSVRIRWASGDVTDKTLKMGQVANPDEDVKKMLHVFGEMIPTVHIAPRDFTNEDGMWQWFEDIGPNVRPSQNRVN